LRKISVVKCIEVDVQPFRLDDFTQDKETHGSMGKVTKKELKTLAESLGLAFSESDIAFSKKLLNAYLAKQLGM